MNDTLVKIQFGLTLITLLILVILLFVARSVEGELRKAQIAIHSQMGVFERKLDTITAALPPPRR